jgi:hypothetical protein
MKAIILKIKNVFKPTNEKIESSITTDKNEPQMNEEEMKKFLVETGKKYKETFKLLAKEDF